MTKLVLVLGGGASRGAYVAGAVREILLALERNRLGRVSISVIVGTSSGAFNAAVAARGLIVNPNLFPWLERIWVEALDADVLLNSQRADRTAILDGSALDELSRALITADPAADDGPSNLVSDPLRLGVTLSNLEGVSYRFRYGGLDAPERFYGLRSHRDWADFELTASTAATDSVWEPIRQAALASASFPFAFPPKAWRRDRSACRRVRLQDSGSEAMEMWYTDGGLFGDEPLGLARRLVERDPNHRGEDWRYIVIDPAMESPDPDEWEVGGSVPERGPRSLPAPAGLAALLSGAMAGRGIADDWARNNDLNERVEILEAVAARLPDLGDRLRDPDAIEIGRSIGELAERIAEAQVAAQPDGESQKGDPVVLYLDENLKRIQADPRFHPAFEGVESRAARTRVAKLIFALEAAAGLKDRERMAVHLVAPCRSGSLGGDSLGGFGAFLDPRLREGDFRAGRRDARQLLEHEFADVVAYDPEDAVAYEAPPNARVPASPDDLSPESRQALDCFVRCETDRILAGLRPGTAGRLLSWAWKPLLRRWATRRVFESLRAAM